jgi:hypothetical protein
MARPRTPCQSTLGPASSSDRACRCSPPARRRTPPWSAPAPAFRAWASLGAPKGSSWALTGALGSTPARPSARSGNRASKTGRERACTPRAPRRAPRPTATTGIGNMNRPSPKPGTPGTPASTAASPRESPFRGGSCGGFRAPGRAPPAGPASITPSGRRPRPPCGGPWGRGRSGRRSHRFGTTWRRSLALVVPSDHARFKPSTTVPSARCSSRALARGGRST